MCNRLQIAMVAALAASLSLGCMSPQASHESRSLCWVEFRRGKAPGAAGAAGTTQPIWQNTASGLFVGHPRGNVLIDAGWSANSAAEMAELSPQKRPIAERVIAGLQMRLSAPEALQKIGITVEQVHYILPTHGHYDHMGGAADLKAATVLLTVEEQQFLSEQLSKPDVVAASNIRSIQPRIKTLTLSPQKYRGFENSLDL